MMKDKDKCLGIFRKPVFFNIAAIFSICLFLACSGYAQQSIVEKYGQLSVEGNRIVNKNGDPVILRGMSLYWSQRKGQFYNAKAIKWLRDDWHCTIVRASMAVESGGYLTNPEGEKQKVKSVVQAAIDLGIYVIINWHDHNAYRHTQQAQAFFEEMAKTYGKYPNIIYELWNEPLNRHDWSTVIKPYHQAVIPRIRTYDPNNIIVCGTQTWSQDVDKAAQDPLKFDNVAYSLHFYAATHKQSLRDKATTALEKGIALVVTEWGTSEATGDGKLDYEETEKWLDFMDRNSLSWCNWSIADLNETSAALKPGANATGNWLLDDLSPSGVFVRKQLRTKNYELLYELKEIHRPDVIYVPTPHEVVDKMLELAEVEKDDLLYDLGCGDGRIVVAAAKKYGCKAVGYDIDPQRVKESLENVQKNNVEDLVTIEQKDIFTLDLSDADVITLYLLPSLNVRLIPQLEKLKPGSRIVSHDFDMKGVTPDKVVKVTSGSSHVEHTIYLWTTPLKKEKVGDKKSDFDESK
jgi:endoglucanase